MRWSRSSSSSFFFWRLPILLRTLPRSDMGSACSSSGWSVQVFLMSSPHTEELSSILRMTEHTSVLTSVRFKMEEESRCSSVFSSSSGDSQNLILAQSIAASILRDVFSQKKRTREQVQSWPLDQSQAVTNCSVPAGPGCSQVGRLDRLRAASLLFLHEVSFSLSVMYLNLLFFSDIFQIWSVGYHVN